MSSFQELREQLTEEDIIRILSEYGYEPVYNKESSKFIVFPTCCHNLEGGSPKLYYYKNTHLFTCFTECRANGSFDIFDLIIKMERLRGKSVGKIFAIQRTGLRVSSRDLDDLASESVLEDISKLYEINNTHQCDLENLNLKPVDINFLDERYVFDIKALSLWAHEGIDFNTMLKYHISYDPLENCIIIPHFDLEGNVVGVRGRYLDEDAVAKYKPVYYNGVQLNHPTNKTLYGYYQNKRAIEMTKTCIIFEAEKSVMMMDTAYDGNNVSVATSGQHISNEHIQILLNSGVRHVVLAYDADYKDDDDINKKFKEYKDYVRPLQAYFTVSIIMDVNHYLGYKDSPIDRGKEVFQKLMKERIYI